METDKEKTKLEQIAKDVYAKQKELDTQLKDFEDQKESLNEIRKDLSQKQKELAQLTSEYKAKNKLLQDVQGKLAELGETSKMADLIQELKKQNKDLEKELKSKGASVDELDRGITNNFRYSYLFWIKTFIYFIPINNFILSIS